MSASSITNTLSGDGEDETGITSPSPVPAFTHGLDLLIGRGLMTSRKNLVLTKGGRQASPMRPSQHRWFQERPPKKPYSSKELISLGNMPSSAQLKSMKTKPYLTIRWKATADDEPVILFESFPRALARAFSNGCKMAGGYHVVIVGSSYQRIKAIFEYMLSSANGQGCFSPPIPEHLRYCTYVKCAVDASIVDVPLIEQEYEARRIMIENVQVHSADVEAIYRDATSKGMAVRENVAWSVARKMFSKTLQAYPVYVQLRKELPEFDADLKKYLKELRKPLEEKRRREVGQRQNRAREQNGADQPIPARLQNDIQAPHGGTSSTRISQPRTAMKVQTSLGIIWAAVPVDQELKNGVQVGMAEKKRRRFKNLSNLSDEAFQDQLDIEELPKSQLGDAVEQIGKKEKSTEIASHSSEGEAEK